jgi:hypothetical protein
MTAPRACRTGDRPSGGEDAARIFHPEETAPDQNTNHRKIPA